VRRTSHTRPTGSPSDSGQVPEQHTFVLVRGEDGRLLIDSDRAG
jgi:hypothetical protein